MMAFKSGRFPAILVFLFVALTAIAECKRGGGGGKIFRATVLKERRNSRRPRDLSARKVVAPISNSLLDEMFTIQSQTEYDDEPQYSLPKIWQRTDNPVINEYLSKVKDLKIATADGDYSSEEDFSTEEVKKLKQYGTRSNAETIVHNSAENVRKYQNSEVVNENDPYDGLFERNRQQRLSNLKKQKKLVMSVLDIIFRLLHRSRHTRHNKSAETFKSVTLSMDSIVSCKDNDFSCPPLTTPFCTETNEVFCVVYKKKDQPCDETFEAVDQKVKARDENAICVVTVALPLRNNSLNQDQIEF